MSAVSYEVAEQEVHGWLKECRFRKRKIESNKEYVDQLIEAVENGDITIDEDTKEIVMPLVFPIGENGSVSELKFKTQLKVKEYRQRLNSGRVQAGDSDGRILAYISALTGQHFNVISELSSEDNSLASSIAIFFF
jgi:hypothetical protein